MQFAGCLLDDCSMFAWSCKQGISYRVYCRRQSVKADSFIVQWSMMKFAGTLVGTPDVVTLFRSCRLSNSRSTTPRCHLLVWIHRLLCNCSKALPEKYLMWILCCRQLNYDFCISQGSVATVIRYAGQNYIVLRQVSFRRSISTIETRCKLLNNWLMVE